MSPEEALTALALWGLLAYPIMPEFSDALLTDIGLDKLNSQEWLKGLNDLYAIPKRGLSSSFAVPAFNVDADTLKHLYSGC